MNELEEVIAEADKKNIGHLIGDLKVMGELYFSLIQKEKEIKQEKKAAIEQAEKLHNIPKGMLDAYVTMKNEDDLKKRVFFETLNLF